VRTVFTDDQWLFLRQGDEQFRREMSQALAYTVIKKCLVGRVSDVVKSFFHISGIWTLFQMAWHMSTCSPGCQSCPLLVQGDIPKFSHLSFVSRSLNRHEQMIELIVWIDSNFTLVAGKADLRRNLPSLLELALVSLSRWYVVVCFKWWGVPIKDSVMEWAVIRRSDDMEVLTECDQCERMPSFVNVVGVSSLSQCVTAGMTILAVDRLVQYENYSTMFFGRCAHQQKSRVLYPVVF